MASIRFPLSFFIAVLMVVKHHLLSDFGPANVGTEGDVGDRKNPKASTMFGKHLYSSLQFKNL